MTQILDAPTLPPPPARTPRTWVPTAVAAGAIALAAPGCFWTASHAHPHPLAHDIGLFAHLASVVVGFGAVLTVDWVATLWLLGRRSLTDVLAAADNVHVPIWLGYSGLVLSGLVLEPDLSSPLTQAKLGLVVLIGWNGLVAVWLRRALEDGVHRRLMVVSVTSATVSQIGWWGAVVIGHVNAR